MGVAPDIRRHAPRKRGIEYAEAAAMDPGLLPISVVTRLPAFAGNDDRKNGERRRA